MRELYSRFVQEDARKLLHRRIQQVYQGSGEPFLSFERRCHIGWGYDMQQSGAHYVCEGLQSVSPPISRVIFQFTLDGHGEYSEKKKIWRLAPGDSFTVLYPSAHRYLMPPTATHWSFFWFIVQHPFVTQRVEELRQHETAVQHWQVGSRALEAAVVLFESLCRRQATELWSFEERLFTWLWETERELYSRRYPENEQQQLLQKTRQSVLRQIENPPRVPDLAGAQKMERTTFSRKFKAATGQSPAAFIMEVRLQEALKQLRTGAKLEEIAAAKGFADANSFSKAFRRHFGVTPGAYRKLVLMHR